MSDYLNLNEGVKETKRRFPKFGSLRLKINRKILLIVLVAVIGIPITVLLSQQEQDTRQFASEKDEIKQEEEPLPPKGYIVEFKNAPASRAVSGSIGTASKENVRNSFNAAKANLLREHESGKADILTKLGKPSFDSSKIEKGDKKVVLLSEFTNSFNGIAIDADESEIEKIKSSSFVKEVYPNLAVRTNLMDSVPLIGADKVWRDIRDSSGNPVTGKGVNIAIIDTGVDYTHKDLGESNIQDREFVKATDNPAPYIASPYEATNYREEDETFSLNNDRVAYFYDRKVIIKNLLTNEKREIPLLVTPAYPETAYENIVLRNNLLAYAVKTEKGSDIITNVFLYNLETNEHKEIVKARISTIDISEGHVIFTGSLSGVSGLYDYNISTNSLKKIEYETSHQVNVAQVYGPEIALAISGETFCYKHVLLYNFLTDETKTVIPENVGAVADFKDNKLIYIECGDVNPAQNYAVYDIKTGETKHLGPAPDSSFEPAGGFSLIGTAALAGNYAFYSQYGVRRTFLHDLSNNRNVQINLFKSSLYIEAEKDRVCFSSLDANIYCHTYKPSESYVIQNPYNNKVIGGYDFVYKDNDAFDDHFHGTHVAGVAAGNGAIKGVAPDARITAYKVFDLFGNAYFSDIIAAVDESIQTRFDSDPQNDVNVMNLSLGGTCNSYSSGCGPDDPPSRALNSAVDNGIFVAVSAGNGGRKNNLISTPGTASKAVTVGAVDKQKKIADFSSKGPVIWNGEDLKKPDVVAPGVKICSSKTVDSLYLWANCLDKAHLSVSGTSMAAPHVAGLAALILQAHPDWTPQQVKDAIKNNADDLGYNYNTQGSGLINALKIFANITPTPSPTPTKKPTPTPSPTPTPNPTPTIKTLKLTPSADAYVRKDNPTNNYGLLKTLKTASNSNIVPFMKFNLSSLSGKKIVSAKLVLKVSDATGINQILKRAANTGWSENTINFNNKPAFEATIETFSAKQVNKAVQIDVTQAVKLRKGGNLTLGIVSADNNPGAFYSRESTSSNRPQLIVEYQ